MSTTDPRKKARTQPEHNWYVSYDNNGSVYTLAILDITGAASFEEETISAYSLPAGGAYVFGRLRTNRAQTASGNLVVTINGWEYAGSAGVTATITFPDKEHEDSGEWAVTSPTGKTFAGISSYSVTGGTAGEKVEIFFLPATTTFKRLGFDPAVTTTPGPGYFNVAKKYDAVDHRKKQRKENAITINDLRTVDEVVDTTNPSPFALGGFRVLLLDQITDDDSGYVKEIKIIEGVIIENIAEPAEDRAATSEAYNDVEGNYDRKTSIAASSTTASAAYIV